MTIKPSKIICECGNDLYIWQDQFTNTCPICGADYDGNGSRLADREKWGMETGETYSDIVNNMPESVIL